MGPAEAGVTPSQFTVYRDYLEALYLHRKLRDQRYSYARFAVDLGLTDASVAHHLVTGKRKLTSKAAVKIANALGLKGVQRQYLLTLVELCNAETTAVREDLQRTIIELRTRTAPTALDKDRLAFLNDWYHPVILDLIASRPEAGPEWLAAALKPAIRVEVARDSVELLKRLGLVSQDANAGRLVPTETSLAVPEGVSELAVVRYQHLMIDLGKDSLATIDPDLRHVTSTSLRIRADQVELLKQKVRDFNAELAAMEASPSATQAVYSVNVQVFPVAMIKDEEGDIDEVA